MITLALGNVREQALSWNAGALVGGQIRNAPASKRVASGGASFVTMVKTADLRDRDHSTQLRRMHFPWFRRVLLQRQVRTGHVVVRKICRQDSAQTGLIANDQPSRPGEFRPEPLTDSGHEPLDSSGSCHPEEACRLPPRQEVRPVAR